MLKPSNPIRGRTLWRPFASALFVLAVLPFVPVSDAAPQQKMLYVQVKESTLRSQPKFWSSTVAPLLYGSELTPIAAAPEDKSWLKVKLGAVEGFVHATAVTNRKLSLGGATKSINPKVDSLSMSLAGKGFNKKVEGAYASSKGIDFSGVDALEAHTVDGIALYAFIHEGKLSEK